MAKIKQSEQVREPVHKRTSQGGRVAKTSTMNKSFQQVIAKLMREDEMTEEDALEHFYYNMMGSYMGDHTPCFLFKEND